MGNRIEKKKRHGYKWLVDSEVVGEPKFAILGVSILGIKPGRRQPLSTWASCSLACHML